MTHDELESAFDRLDTDPRNAAWRAPDDIRRVARRRRRVRRSLGLTATALVVGGVLVAVVAVVPSHPSSHPSAQPGFAGAQQLVADVQPLAQRDDTAAKSLVAAEQQFAIDLLKHTNSTDNSVLSPAGLAIALAMVQTGAKGATRDEIASMLHTSTLSPTQQDAGWAALVGDLANAKGVTVQSANSLWLKHGLPVQRTYLDALARYFRTGVWQVDFDKDLPGAEKAINQWASDKTHGTITTLFGPHDLSTDTVLVLANALYFEAAWKTAFDPKSTRSQTFVQDDGSTEQVPFMTSSKDVQDLVTDAWQSVQIPYAGGRYAAMVVMPTQGTLHDFVARLTPQQLATFARTDHDYEGELSLPRFRLQTYANLDDTMQAMGMRTAFGSSADFSALSTVPLQVQSVVQRDVLKVDEHGTKAAAVTGISAIPLSGRIGPKLQPFNHPFLFLVRDTKTGAILFSAQVNDPQA